MGPFSFALPVPGAGRIPGLGADSDNYTLPWHHPVSSVSSGLVKSSPA